MPTVFEREAARARCRGGPRPGRSARPARESSVPSRTSCPGGMLQRVMIANALAVSPRLLIADEPTTALDVTIQQQILELVEEIQARTGMAVVWVTHDLGVIARLVERVVVMYAGRVVERAPTARSVRPPEPSLHALPCSARCPRSGRGTASLSPRSEARLPTRPRLRGVCPFRGAVPVRVRALHRGGTPADTLGVTALTPPVGRPPSNGRSSP